ncbi:MAG: hypothetical protein LBI44_00675 [Oscillospiraceae bacterium]|nr:hypothetical protein [Oscillospiraceae bacterium]
MKKTINKKTYNTDTGKHIGQKYHGEYGQPDGFEEQLFVAEDGKHFIYGAGGPDSPYPVPDIKVLTEKAATDWKKENGIG